MAPCAGAAASSALMWACLDSNQGPRDYESPALTAVLQARRKPSIVPAGSRRKNRQSGPSEQHHTRRMSQSIELLWVAKRINDGLSGRLSLQSLSRGSGLSSFQLHGALSRLTGSSPARYTRHLRLLLAATELLRSDATVPRIARRCGFASTEVLIRNFCSHLRCTPVQFRRRAASSRADPRFLHGLKRVKSVAPCLPFFPLQPRRSSSPMPMLSTAIRTIEPQHALVIRSRVPRSEIAATIGQNLGRIVPYALGAGGVLAGQPFARYPDFGPGMITIEVGMPLAAPVAGQDDIESFTLPAGLTAVAMHGGAYEKLPETFAAFEAWIASEEHQPAGPPWEVYVNDPAEHPDPADWRTEIYWPVR